MTIKTSNIKSGYSEGSQGYKVDQNQTHGSKNNREIFRMLSKSSANFKRRFGKRQNETLEFLPFESNSVRRIRLSLNMGGS